MGEGKRFNEEANESDKLALARETRAMKGNLIALNCGCVMTLTIINQFDFGIKPLNYSPNITILLRRETRLGQKNFIQLYNIEIPKLLR